MAFTNDDVARYYDVTEQQYRRMWQLQKSRSLHYGLWDASTKNFHEALLNTNKVLANLARVNSTDTVLDAGCGIGGSSLWLAANKKCTVTGISLSAKQVATGNALAKKEGLDDLVHLEKRDYTATGFPDACFDVVWAIESICQANDKNDFVKEAYRILKPGGRLIMADYFKQPGLAGKDAKMMQDWAHGWALNDFEVLGIFENMLKNAGFNNVDIKEVTDAIRPSAKRMYLTYFPGAVAGFLYRIFHPRSTEFGKKNIITARLQYKTLQKKLWQYHLVLAYK